MRTLLKMRLAVDSFNDTLGPQSGIEKELSHLECSAMSTGKSYRRFEGASIEMSVTMVNLPINMAWHSRRLDSFLSRDVYIIPKKPTMFRNGVCSNQLQSLWFEGYLERVEVMDFGMRDRVFINYP